MFFPIPECSGCCRGSQSLQRNESPKCTGKVVTVKEFGIRMRECSDLGEDHDRSVILLRESLRESGEIPEELRHDLACGAPGILLERRLQSRQSILTLAGSLRFRDTVGVHQYMVPRTQDGEPSLIL